MELPLPLCMLVQQGIATALHLDPGTRASLSRIDGKVIRVVVTQPSVALHLSIVDNQVDVVGHFDAEPDTTIQGSLKDLLSLKNANDALYTGAVEISGDSDTAHELRSIIDAVDIDIEEVFAPVTGDTIAHQFSRFGKQFGGWLSQSGDRLKRNTSEYLQEEVQFLAPASEVTYFCNEVDELRSSADRLEARLLLLEKMRQQA